MSKKEVNNMLKIANFICGILGLTIIWFASHSVVAVLGGVVAALHFTVGGDNK